MTEHNRHNTGANSSSGDKGEHSFYTLAPQPLLVNDPNEAAKRELAEAAKKAEEEINKTLVDSVPILVRRSSIDAEVEALKKAPTHHQISSTNRFGIRVAASRLQEQAARRPSSAQKNASVVNQTTPTVTPDSASPEDLAADSSASSPRPRKPIISAVDEPIPDAKPLERPLMSSGPVGPRALVTPTKPRTLNSITVKRLAIHAAPSSLRIAAPQRSTVLTRNNPLITRQSPLDGREAMLRNNPQPRATRPIVGVRTASGAIVAAPPRPGQAAGNRPAVVAGKGAPQAAKAAPAANRPAVVAGRPVPQSNAKAAPAAKRPAVVAGRPVPRDAKPAAGGVVAGQPVAKNAKPAGAVVAGRPASAGAAPAAAGAPAAGAAAAPASKTSAKVRNAGHFLKRREASSALRKRNFAESEPDLSLLPWTEGMLKLAAVPLLSDFFQVDAVMFQSLSTYVHLELHTVKDYFSNCYSSESFALELSLLSEQIPVLNEAYDALPTEEIEVKESAAKDAGEADKDQSAEAKEDEAVGDEDGQEVKDKKDGEADESGESKDAEDNSDTEDKSKEEKVKKKLILSPQPLAINGECCRQFFRAYYPEMKDGVSDLLVSFYVLGGNENAEGIISSADNMRNDEDESDEADSQSIDKADDNQENESAVSEETAEETKAESPVLNEDNSLCLGDGFDLNTMLDSGGEIQLNDIKLDDLSFDDLLSGM